MHGEGEEDLIEGGPAHRDVLDGGALLVQDPQRLHQAGAAVVHRYVGAAGGNVDPWTVTEFGQHFGDRREVVSVVDVHLDHVVPGAGLQLRGRTGGDHLAVGDDDDV